MSSKASLVDVYTLTQPELLSISQLIQILESRLVNLNHKQKTCKEDLVEIFKRVSLPLPQRIYSDNNLGRRLTKLRNDFEKNRKKTFNNGFKELSNDDKQKEKDSLNSQEVINYERKKIKLNSNSGDKNMSPSSMNSSSGFAQKRSTSPNTKSSPPIKQRKKIVWP